MSFDIIVVGGGHAGTEAAAAAARMGARVALLSFDRHQIGTMSCNPAIGGLGKGHLVREVDALDGLMAVASDRAAIHYRMLNSSKGAAVRGPRIQADRKLYRTAIQSLLETQEGLELVEGEAAVLVMEGRRVTGVELSDGRRLGAGAVVLATGTFLGGRLHFGLESRPGGRTGEKPATRLGLQLRALDLPMARLKTGTPPRLDGRTIDWSRLERQESDASLWTFSPMSRGRVLPQLFCAVTRTNKRTHQIIRDNLDRSPLFSGQMQGIGPRYCPSIEDKVHRFADRDSHQIFLEPEGLDDPIIYPNGMSTSLPVDAQIALVRTMEGLKQAEIAQPGYAVEYDHVDPRVLDPTLAVRDMEGLYLAGQINGTTGYEEAAGQGLVAGLNAAAALAAHAPIIFDRSESYIGVMIDDLILHGVTEPYRMLTARAEFRLRLRADNAGSRLTPLGLAAGCIGEDRRRHFIEAEAHRAEIRAFLAEMKSGAELAAAGVEVRNTRALHPLGEWLRLAAIERASLERLTPELAGYRPDLVEEIVQDLLYAPYVARQSAEIRRLKSDEAVILPPDLDYRSIPGLSNEMAERLTRARPTTLGAASRVHGVTPAALATIMVRARRRAA